MIVFGIDPGLNGAVSIISLGERPKVLEIYDLKLCTVPCENFVGREFRPSKLAILLLHLIRTFTPVVIGLEICATWRQSKFANGKTIQKMRSNWGILDATLREAIAESGVTVQLHEVFPTSWESNVRKLVFKRGAEYEKVFGLEAIERYFDDSSALMYGKLGGVLKDRVDATMIGWYAGTIGYSKDALERKMQDYAEDFTKRSRIRHAISSEE